MTSKLGFGLFNHVTPFLRIAYDPATPLHTEPASNYGKFKFDSFNTKLSYIFEMYVQGYDSRYDNGGSDGFWGFANHDLSTVTGTGQSQIGVLTNGAFIWWSHGGFGDQYLSLYSNWWNFGYFPILEARWQNPSLPTNVYAGAKITYVFFSGIGGNYGLVESFAGYSGAGTTIGQLPSTSSYWREGYVIQTRSSASSQNLNNLISVLQLPQRNDALPDYSTTIVSGQQVCLINKTTARLALPGRTVSDTDPNNFIFREDKVPMKIMNAGDVNIAGSGSVDIFTTLPITPLTYMDFMVKAQADAEFWHPPWFNGVSSNGNYAFKYEVKSDRITITNTTSTAITVRYVIFANNDAVPTSGGKKVFYNGFDGTNHFQQIKRPGSSDVAPNLADIIVDTRLAYLPILAQGFLNWPGDFPTTVTGSDRYKGEKMATITIGNPTPSLKLFCKQIVVFPSLSTPFSTYSGYHRVFADNTGGWQGRASGFSSWARVYSDESAVDLYMAGDNPYNVGYGASPTQYVQQVIGNPSNSFANCSALGLRYYIFGIPAAL